MEIIWGRSKNDVYQLHGPPIDKRRGQKIYWLHGHPPLRSSQKSGSLDRLLQLRSLVTMLFALSLTPLIFSATDYAGTPTGGSTKGLSTNVPTVIPTITPASASGSRGGAGSSGSIMGSDALAAANYDFSSTAMGVYTGPGNISGHNNFENWLGESVPYASDYIDYRGGWATDFNNSGGWLAVPWGKWASSTGGRLVLGVPMLENSNIGQFNNGVNGQFDSYFNNLASQLVANNLGNSIIRLGYEANCNTIGPWQATDNPSGYIALFRHEVSVMKSVPGARFLFDWSVCNGLQTGHALNSFASFYPGDDVVNIAGIDIYDVDWGNTSVSPQERWSYITTRQMGVNDFLAFAAAHGKPVSYPEWGLYAPGDSFAGGGDNPYFIDKMAGLISNTKPLYQAYFDLDWGGGILADFPQGQSVFKQIFSQ